MRADDAYSAGEI